MINLKLSLIIFLALSFYLNSATVKDCALWINELKPNISILQIEKDLERNNAGFKKEFSRSFRHGDILALSLLSQHYLEKALKAGLFTKDKALINSVSENLYLLNLAYPLFGIYKIISINSNKNLWLEDIKKAQCKKNEPERTLLIKKIDNHYFNSAYGQKLGFFTAGAVRGLLLFYMTKLVATKYNFW